MGQTRSLRLRYTLPAVADLSAIVKFGRKPTLTPHQQSEARARLNAGEKQRSVARSYNVSQSTISRLAA